MGGGGDWSELPDDILDSIAKRLDIVKDYFSMAQVCKSWESIAFSPYNLPIPLQPPFLLLAEPKIKEEEEEEDKTNTNIPISSHRGLVGLKDSKVYELHLPELHQNRCIGSTGSWLFLINLQLEIHMFNPFTRTRFSLPSQTTLPEQWPTEYEDDYTLEHVRDAFIGKLILTSTPKSDLDIDLAGVVAMVVYGSQRNLAISKPGDKFWTPIQTEIPAVAAVDNVIFFNNQFYIVNCRGKVAVCDIDSNPPQATMLLGDFKPECRVSKYYLVEWLGELLLVAKYCVYYEEEPYYKTGRFAVYKLNFENLEWEEVKNLGQHSLFLGFNTSVSLLASHPSSTFRRNCIYFTDDNSLDYIGTDSEGGHDMGIFDLADGTISPHYTGISTSLNSPPLWIIPKSTLLVLNSSWKDDLQCI